MNRTVYLAVLLGFVGGFVDAAGFLGLGGLFTSHVTGNLAVLGARLARQETRGAATGLAFIPIFAAAVGMAGLIAHATRHRRFGDAAALLLAESSLLFGAAIAGQLAFDSIANADALAIAALGATAVVAMGIQNGMMRVSFGGNAPTTVMTGNVTQLSLDLLGLMNTPRKDAKRWHAVVRRIRQHGAALAGFVMGAAAGAFLERAGGMVCLAVPAAVLMVLGLVELIRRFRAPDAEHLPEL